MNTLLPSLRRMPLLLLCVLAACAEGGEQDLPPSDVTLAADHHLLWFRSLPGFGAAATRAAAVFTGNGVLALGTDSNYRIHPGSTSPQRYALADDGALSIFNIGSGREPSTRFAGAYRLVGTDPDLFFTDRVAAGTSTSIGLYYGTRTRIGQAELEGGWHLLSLHVILPPLGAAALPRNVARAAHGEVSIGAGAPGTLRTLSGTGLESGNDPSAQPTVTFGGSIQNLLDQSNTGDGTCNLTVSYLNVGGTPDQRVFRAAAGRDFVIALDDGENDNEVGMLMLVRKFDAPATPAVASSVAGTWLLGGYTVFTNATNNGCDAFIGTLSLTAQGGFRLDAEGHQGIDFSYAGTFTLETDGRLTLSVNGTSETWTAAINRTYDTLVLVDDFTENRANNQPELNFVLGVRKKID